MAEINILGGLLAGGLRGIGQQMLANSERERRGQLAQRQGAQMFPDAFGPDGVANGDKLSSGMYAAGEWEQGLPLVTQAIGNRNAISMEMLQQKNALERLDYGNNLAMQSWQQQQEYAAKAAFSAVPPPAMWQGLAEAKTSYQQSEQAFVTAQNLNAEIEEFGTTEYFDPARSSRIKSMAIKLAEAGMRPGNASDDEFARALQSEVGITSLDELDRWATAPGANARVTGALQQTMARHQLAAKTKSDDLTNYTAGNKWLSADWNSVAQQQPAAIRNYNPALGRVGEQEQAQRRQGLERKATTREEYKNRTEEAQ